jgi:hypothetical protein
LEYESSPKELKENGNDFNEKIAYYEILNGCSLELLLTKKFSEVVKSNC